MAKRKTNPVPAILPREKLTKKALAAIGQYTMAKSKKLELYTFSELVRYVLQAERMRRSELYAWLEERGYRWMAKYGIWEKEKE